MLGPCPAQQFALISHGQLGFSDNLLGRALPANTSTATTRGWVLSQRGQGSASNTSMIQQSAHETDRHTQPLGSTPGPRGSAGQREARSAPQDIYTGLLLQDQEAQPTCLVKEINTELGQRKSSIQFNSVAQPCPTLCNPMDCSTPGFPVHHYLPELAQSHVH